MKLTSRTMMAKLEKLEDMSSLVRTQASPLWISAWWWMESFWQSNVDHVPELGVMSVLEHVQPLEEEIKIRTHHDKVCSVWPLNLDWDVVVFLNFRFAIFLEIRFVFCLNKHLLNFTNWFNIWSWGDITCIAWFKSLPPGCVTALPHCVGMPYWHYQLVLSWYLH